MGENRNGPLLKIGELAQRLGLNVRTIRYYEAIGLLPAPARTEGGYRLYSPADERRLRFVLQAKRVGFSLEEIQRILRLGEHGSACDYVRETLVRHIAEIEAKIADGASEQVVRTVTENCRTLRFTSQGFEDA